MKIVFYIYFLTSFYGGFSQKIFFLEDIKKDVKANSYYGTSLMNISNNKLNRLYSFNHRYSFSDITIINNNLYALVFGDNYIYQQRNNKILKNKIFENSTYSFFVKNNLRFSNSVFIGSKRNTNNFFDNKDTTYVYEYDFAKDENNIVLKYINDTLYSVKKSFGFFSAYSIDLMKDKKVCETIKMFNLKTKQVTVIDTLYLGYEDSSERLNLVFNVNNIQVLDDNTIIYSYYRHDSFEKGRNFVFSYSLFDNKSKLILMVNDKFPLEGFFLEKTTNRLYLNNEEEIYYIDIVSKQKSTCYKMNRTKSYKLTHLILN